MKFLWQSLHQEWLLLMRSRAAMAALGLLLALSTLAVVSGLREVQRQRDTIERVITLQQDYPAPKSRSRDAGTAAYYTFHPTWDPPSAASFLALGLRDTNPYVLRVRALALQAQLHEGETHNPELALLGRVDFAFVLVYLAPLFLIALLYDLVSSERAAGRLGTLSAMPGGNHLLWLRRAALRAGLVFMALALPATVGAWSSGTPAGLFLQVLAATLAYLLFWVGLALGVASRSWTSATNAIALMGCWAVLTLVFPSLAHLAISRASPAHQGAELMLAQREAVHAAWDKPREETLERFFQSHPEWRDTAPLPAGFHWKWYYAFQQLGDESVADRAADYREALLARQRWTTAAGWLLPSVAAQTVLHRAAQTDLLRQLAYQDAIAAFHARLRRFYYPYLFNDRPFHPHDMAAQPRFEPASHHDGGQLSTAWGLFLVAALALAIGSLSIRRVDRVHSGRALKSLKTASPEQALSATFPPSGQRLSIGGVHTGGRNADAGKKVEGASDPRRQPLVYWLLDLGSNQGPTD